MVPASELINKAHDKHLFLIDGYGFVFRAYHSLPPLNRADGMPVGAVYGFTNMLLKLRNEIEESNEKNPGDHYMAVILDAGKKTFRNDIYPEYKANRPPAPEDLIPQFPLVREAAKALNLPVIDMVGYEADDLIATYAKMAERNGLQVTIVSSDKDLMQLVNHNITMYDSMKGRLIAEKQVAEKFGVAPDKVLDVLALMGDSSDNIPGVPGIGPKTAAELINTYGSLDELLARADEIKQPRRREALKEFAEQANLSRKLARLDEKVPVNIRLDDMLIQEINPDKVIPFLEEQNFKSLVAKFKRQFENYLDVEKEAKTMPARATANYSLIENVKSLEEWLNQKNNPEYIAILLDEKNEWLALALPGQACFMKIENNSPAPQETLGLFDADIKKNEDGAVSLKEALRIMAPVLADLSVLKIGNDIKRFLRVARNHDVNIEPLDDIMLMSYVLDGARHRHDLPAMAERELGLDISMDKKAASPDGEKIARRADILAALAKIYKQRLFAEKMLTIYETIERPLISALADMENAGIKVDATILAKLSGEFEARLEKLEKEIHSFAGHKFNIGSPKQLGEVLFEEMSLPGGKKSKKAGSYSTGADILEELSAQGHDIADTILEWRALSKLKSTYTDSLPKQIDKKTGRIHTIFGMTTTSTGRLSSHNPNLQNIPIRSESGKKIRAAFVAKEGYRLISADYSQIELRLVAQYANVGSLKDAFANGLDIHALTASQVFGIKLEEVNSDHRRKAKAINFGIIYGLSAFGLANQLGIGRGDAKKYIEKYFEQYPGIEKYMAEVKEIAREKGYVTTLFGRKCFLPGIASKNPALRQFAERAAINAPLQGTAADIIKKAMIALPKALKKENLDARQILQIHDELLIEVLEKDAEKTAKIIKKVMENAVKLEVPLIVEVNAGNNWGEIH